jgi:hypothetical protein
MDVTLSGLTAMPAATAADPGSPKLSGSAFSFMGGDKVLLDSGAHHAVSPHIRLIPQAWASLISRYDWQWFATLTFRDHIHPEAASKAYRHWLALLDKSNGFRYRSRKTHKRRCVWVRGLEWQKRGVLHFHALIGNLPLPLHAREQRDAWGNAWCSMGNTGFAYIEGVGQTDVVGKYIAKYAAKGGEVDVSHNLPAFSDFGGVTTSTT